MPATLLVLDIDGTLRPHGEPRVPKENVDALRTVQKAGVKLVIATGAAGQRSPPKCCAASGRITGSAPPVPRWRMPPGPPCTPAT